MGKWAARLVRESALPSAMAVPTKAHFGSFPGSDDGIEKTGEPLYAGTAKADERGLLAVLTVTPKGGDGVFFTQATTTTTTTAPADDFLALLPTVAAPAVDPDRWCWPHSDAMNTAEIARFIGRGIAEAEAERLADELLLADRRPSSSSAAPVPPARPAARSCAACTHLTRRSTCTEPVGAGLAETFGIVWPAPGHGAGCAAYRGKS